jgi:hypothetical protein
MSPVNVHCIADIFKRVKRNPDRQDHIQRVEACVESFIDGRDKKVGVFEINEQAKVIDDAQDKEALPCDRVPGPVDRVGEIKINDRGEHDQDHEQVAGLVKEIKGKKTKDIPTNPEIVPEPVIQAKKDGKEEYKKPIVEQQRIFFIIQKLMKKSVYVE